MRKIRCCLHVTLHGDSKTLSYFVEANNGEGRWELWTEGDSLPLSAASAACDELLELLRQTTADWSLSTSRSSD